MDKTLNTGVTSSVGLSSGSTVTSKPFQGLVVPLVIWTIVFVSLLTLLVWEKDHVTVWFVVKAVVSVAGLSFGVIWIWFLLRERLRRLKEKFAADPDECMGSFYGIGFSIIFMCSPGSVYAFFITVRALIQSASVFWPFVLGLGLGLCTSLWFLRKNRRFRKVIHGLGHATVSLMFFRRPTLVSPGCCSVGTPLKGGIRTALINEVVAFGPHILPIIYVVSVLIGPLLGMGFFPWYYGWMGFTLGCYFVNEVWDAISGFLPKPVGEFGPGFKKGIERRRAIMTCIFILLILLIVHGVLLSVVADGFVGLRVWLKAFMWGIGQVLSPP